MSVTITSANSMLTAAKVNERTALSRTTIWRMVRAGKFPAPFQIGTNRVAGDAPTQKGLALGIEQLAALIAALKQAGKTVIEAEDDPLSKRYRAIMAGERA